MTNKFVYVTYIRTTADKLWAALTEPEFTRAYWFGITQESTWKAGASWKMMFEDGKVADSGSVVEADRPRRLVLSWRNEFMPELKAEGYSRCTYDLEPTTDAVKLTITHEIENGPNFIKAVSGGWPQVLASLKSFLETGKALERQQPCKTSEALEREKK
jgi:uncharacterized protein YndB with AHSA1/START domain